MKIYSLITAGAIAAFALVGCNKETSSPVTNPDAGTKAITVTINGANLTKGSSQIVGDDPYKNEHEFKTIDIYFTTANDNVVYSRSINPTDDQNEWSSLVGGTGVRYVGLDGVSKVYVIANRGNVTAPTEGQNMNQIFLQLQDYPASAEQNVIPFMGGDADITPLRDELADGFDGPSYNIEKEQGVATPDEGQQYYTADIDIRPVISRLEIGKISVQTSGYSEEIDGATIGENYKGRTFRVHWAGFNPVLGGIYMSNFYRKWTPLPAKNPASDLFVTPTGQSGIENGKWANLEVDLNQDGATFYSNWNGASYDQLFSYTQKAEGENTVYYDGEGTTCVPFNFLVNYDVTAEGEDIESDPEISKTNGNHPTFHIQFQYDGSGYTYTAEEETSEGVWEKMDEAKDPLLYLAIVGKFSLAVTNDNIYYANIVQFKENDAPVAIKPAKIYKMDAVTITPANITTGTVAPADEYNVIVNVNVIDFDTINVTPEFE